MTANGCSAFAVAFLALAVAFEALSDVATNLALPAWSFLNTASASLPPVLECLASEAITELTANNTVDASSTNLEGVFMRLLMAP